VASHPDSHIANIAIAKLAMSDNRCAASVRIARLSPH
jgi:hypothetical protein